MNKIKIIQNPSSGKIGYEDEFNEVCRLLLDYGYTVQLFKTKGKNDAYLETKKAVEEGFECIVVSGGDGTVNEVARGLYEMKTTVPMAIFKTGTVNDFANHLKLPNTAFSFLKMIQSEITLPVDIGLLNGQVFVNIAAAGIFTSVAHDTKKEVKKYLGRNAYYLEALMNLPKNLSTYYPLRITTDKFTTEGEYHLFLITNSSSVGGFDKISPTAEIQDGYFDCMFIKRAPIVGQADVFMKILVGKHLDNKHVDYFQTKKIKIELLNDDELVVDLDGEYGGTLPIEIEVKPSAIYIMAENE
ncbi:MAG: YegS/Rv2252/BmrU family lipid kinase [Clostridia bacterium]|nr:YegS/Rv2252/BmrU family lipid kinase [Clostridia bacterium]